MTEGDLLSRITHEQRRAADPEASAWVSANAGSGKTKVLSDRVLRLLLAGTPPGKILCLTFTKAAAANMAIRVFERLGRWVTLDDAALTGELATLEGVPPDLDTLRFARRLFARAVETPGGLKIDTIHAFCERILHMVPFEANVPARFAVLDESQSAKMMEAVLARVLGEAGSASSPLNEPWRIVSRNAAGEGFDALIRTTVARRWLFADKERPAAAIRRLRRRFGLTPDATPEGIVRAMLEEGLPPAEWPAIADALAASAAATDQKQAGLFRSAAAAANPEERLRHYRTIFFTDKGEPRASLATKKADPALKDRLAEEQARLAALDDAWKSAQSLERTGALFTLAGAIRRGVEAEKARLGALDFDDLIAKTLELLARGEAAWVLYKLDRGVDHILVDEAQDTNPEQWEILRRLTEDFTAGAGAADARTRTIFAVGDPKQSIYGFQGADPQKFEESRRHWRKAVTGARLRFEDVPLHVSFRSARAVLSAVDATFAVPAHYRGLSFEDGATGTVHETTRGTAPGHVELWPVERPEEAEEPEAWVLPVDAPERSSPPLVLARRIARAIKAWTERGDEWGRRRRPGDILILVKKRSAAFFAVIRALKDAGVPVAGADRLDIGRHIAVQDLVAAGRAALLPDDDLTLAAVLKSPLVGLAEDDLLRLAARRGEGESLRLALARHAATGDAAARVACEALAIWRDLSRRHGPFGFYATLLGPLGGRRRLVARLGSEAGDAIDAFLSLAQAAEQPETPSLATFLTRFGSAAHEVKRDLDATGDEVRVMTVHGAKGLEAPVVILIDGCQVFGPGSPLVPVVSDPETLEMIPVWSPGKAYDCAAIAEAREAHRIHQIEEHNRLLYVAMTRAKDRLVIAPFMTSARETPAEAWCEMVRKGLVLKAGGLVRRTAPYGEIEVWHEGEAGTEEREAVSDPLPAHEAPAWLHAPVEPEPEPAPPIRPSGALGAAERIHRPGDGPAAPQARLVGTLVHALLERLPGLPFERWADAARAYVSARAPAFDTGRRESVVRQALGVLTHEALAPLFGPGSRAEAAIAGRILTASGAVPVSGQIDRLAVREHEVLIADFKTTARPPDPDVPAPAAYVGQLALYRALVAEIYPDRPVRAFLVWTAGPVIRELAEEELAGALALIRAA
ncbi:MAG TPA: double-strand break repair helicase AddA [Microvirga sp.]|jgi:ATP-dependent helicase/nuclease subunit A|nr:double-strand break repair helicase AddA [Microvirga sp.]